MSESVVDEKGKLWAIALLMTLPSFLWLAVVAFIKAFHITINSYMDWTTIPSLAFNLAIFALPFFWKGKLNGVAVIRRAFRSFDLTSVMLALAPVVIWIGALYALTAGTSQPFQLRWPLASMIGSPYWLPTLLSSVIGGSAHAFAMLVLASAEKPTHRTVALASVIYFGMLMSALTYVVISWRSGLPDNVLAQASPMHSIVQGIGTLACILALASRQKFGALSAAVFLISMWVFRMMGYLPSIEASCIGLLGGAVVICLVNYLQQSGRWLPWSAEKQT